MMEINVAGMKPSIPSECFISAKHYISCGLVHQTIYTTHILILIPQLS
jgi:hypothetical protein